ncbi:MAG: hypothetical protein ACTHK2_15145 [Dokdonella sp.]|uniref:hypothetical protein n=1 Tax=Dokdonella sp. TaxID=2291710 RepID=UPI003F807C9B
MTAAASLRVVPGRTDRIVVAVFVALAALLLILALLWRVPMMLWDHLDLVPIYERYLQGALPIADLVRIHGGHLHAGAYAVLLVTTDLSHGATWLDVVASMVFLLAYATVITMLALRLARDRDHGLAYVLILIAFALYPGHLANLQWGWQVAVFVCLAGAVAAIALLSAPVFTAMRGVAALACAACAFASFAIGFAVLPVGALVLALRRDLTRPARWAWVAIWGAATLAAAWLLHRGAPTGRDFVVVARYALNFLGAGVARYATDPAPWLGAAALASGLAFGWRHRARTSTLPWLGLFLFGVASAFLTAYGRAGDYGAEQAFATRYVSFSSVFWLGWLGLLAQCPRDTRRQVRGVRCATAAVAVLATFNAVHLMKKAAVVAARSQAVADTIRRTYPDVPEHVLADIYFDQPAIARERLARLRAWEFAPFDRRPDQ